MGSPRRHRHLRWGYALASALVLGGVIAFNALDTGDKIASVASGLLTLATFALSWLDPNHMVPLDTASAGAYHTALATGARELLQREAAASGLRFPQPLRVPWTAVNCSHAADPDVVLDRLPGVRRTALRLSGDVTTLADVVNRHFPARQVVILGEAGSGKSSAAILFAQRIAKDMEIPLLVDLVAWNPKRHDLDEWLASSLTAVHRSSLSTQDAHAVASRLVSSGAVIPVLDGLDELSHELREQVIRTIHAWTRPFVLTSQPSQYKSTVDRTGYTVARALVVNLEPLPATEIITHLTAGRAHARRRWAPVITRLYPPGPLRDALASPLICTTAKNAYHHIESRPDELLTLETRGDVEHHLFERAYPRDGAGAWLTALARFLTRTATQQFDLGGPMIPAHWSRLRHAALTLSVIASYIAIIALLARIEWSGPLLDKFMVLLLWLGSATVFLVVRLATRRGIDTARPFRLRIRPTRILAGATASAAGTLIITTLSASTASAALPDLKTTVIVVVFFTVTAAVIGGTDWGRLTEPTVDDGTPHPPSTIHRDGWTLAAHLPAPILCATIFCGLSQQWNAIPPTAALALIVLTYRGDHVPGAGWSRWVVRRILLTRHGLPMEIELEKSLDTARNQGILRTAGTRYRFQHIKIQEHLAQAARPTDQRPPHPSPPPRPSPETPSARQATPSHHTWVLRRPGDPDPPRCACSGCYDGTNTPRRA